MLNSQVFPSCKYSCVAGSLCQKAVDERKTMTVCVFFLKRS